MSESDQLKFGVIGGGSWGTAIVKMLQQNLPQVGWWVRERPLVDHILEYGFNPKYISAARFDVNRLNISTDMAAVVAESDVLVLAIPSAFVHRSLQSLGRDALANKSVVSAVKGIVPETNQIVGEYLQSEFNMSLDNIGVVTGPCHAEEVALEKLSYLTIAAQNETLALAMSAAVQSRFVQTTVSDDIIGTEYSAVMKNVMAIACGIAHGLNYGDNFQAVLVSNAIQEMDRFIRACYPLKRDIKSSAYLGDLLVTAYSQFSRNRTLGNMLGKGYTIKSALVEMGMVAEGYYAVDCVHTLNEKLNVDMPITSCVYNVLYRGVNPVLELKRLEGLLS